MTEWHGESDVQVSQVESIKRSPPLAIQAFRQVCKKNAVGESFRNAIPLLDDLKNGTATQEAVARLRALGFDDEAREIERAHSNLHRTFANLTMHLGDAMTASIQAMHEEDERASANERLILKVRQIRMGKLLEMMLLLGIVGSVNVLTGGPLATTIAASCCFVGVVCFTVVSILKERSR